MITSSKVPPPAGAATAARWLGAIAAFAALAAAVPARAQVPDTVIAHSASAVLQMDAAGVVADKDYSWSGPQGTALLACKQSIYGFFCIDTVAGVAGIYSWSAVTTKGPGKLEFTCAQLGGKACTGLTVDGDGALWIAVRKNNSHSLLKVVKGACSGITVGSYCATDYYSGRPPLIDIDAPDRETADLYRVGVLGLEERKTAVFFPDPKVASPTVLATGKDWGLQVKEELHGLTLQQVRSTGGARNYVLAVTSLGRLLQREIGSTDVARSVYTLPAGTTPCTTSGAQNFEVRASARTGRVYVTDRNFCRVFVLEPTAADNPALKLVSLAPNPLSTFAAAGAYPTTIAPANQPPVGITVGEGLSLDIAGCGGTCPIGGTADKPAAALVGVDVMPGPSGVTIFQVRNIPDCRWKKDLTAEQIALCDGAVIAPASGPNVEATQQLNVTKLLPTTITRLYDKSGGPPNGLPPLILPPEYRAQAGRGYVFDALFVVPQRGVRFNNTFIFEFDVPVLTETGASTCFTPANPTLANLLRWDVTATVSEIYGSGTAAAPFVARLTNSNCRNPTQAAGERLSLLPYTLEVTPTTYAPVYGGGPEPKLVVNNDAVFARLVQKMYDDLNYVRGAYACSAVDGPDGGPPPNPAVPAPLDGATCTQLRSIWENGKAKLDKCIAAAFAPKTSAGDENCQSFVSQLTNFQSAVPAATGLYDFANRAGELKARASAIRHVFQQRFLPSIPAGGFCVETNTCTATSP